MSQLQIFEGLKNFTISISPSSEWYAELGSSFYWGINDKEIHVIKDDALGFKIKGLLHSKPLAIRGDYPIRMGAGKMELGLTLTEEPSLNFLPTKSFTATRGNNIVRVTFSKETVEKIKLLIFTHKPEASFNKPSYFTKEIETNLEFI